MNELFEGIEIAEETKQQLQERFAKELQEKEKLATVNANRILDSVGNQFAEKFKVERLANETKITDYLNRAVSVIGENANKLNESKIIELSEQLKKLEDEKQAGFTDESAKQEISSLKSMIAELNDKLQSKDSLIQETENKYKTELSSYKIDNGFRVSMPEFNKEVNKFELSAKKKDAINKIKEQFELKLNDEGILIAENKQTFQTKEVKTLLTEMLSDYLPQEKVTGGGATPTTKTGVGELVIPKEISDSEKRAMIISHLDAKGIHKMHSDYSKEFQKLWSNK